MTGDRPIIRDPSEYLDDDQPRLGELRWFRAGPLGPFDYLRPCWRGWVRRLTFKRGVAARSGR